MCFFSILQINQDWEGFLKTLADALIPVHLIAKTLVKFNQIYSVMECSELLHKLSSINSTVEQLHKKLEFLEHRFRCFDDFTFFSKFVEPHVCLKKSGAGQS